MNDQEKKRFRGNDLRLQMFSLSQDLLLKLLRGEIRVNILPWPADAEVVSVHYEFAYRSFAVTIRSAEFEEVPEGHIVPMVGNLSWMITRIADE